MNNADTITNIFKALGGQNRLSIMTGANSFMQDGSTLSFKIGRNPRGVTHVRVTLSDGDVYSMELLKVRGVKVTVLTYMTQLFGEDLQGLLAERTGLALSL